MLDLKSLAPNELQSLDPAYKKYNEEQYILVKLPDGSGMVCERVLEGAQVTAVDETIGDSLPIQLPRLEPLFRFRCRDFIRGGPRCTGTIPSSLTLPGLSLRCAQKTSSPQSHPLDSPHADLIRSLQSSFKQASAEHFPASTIAILPTDNTITLLLVANKYSPQNFWNARWRSTYTYNPSSSTLSGTVKIDVHYYEDGNVRMSTSKKVEGVQVAGEAEAICREVSKYENKFQEEVNKGFSALSEGSFKGLRRQLPVTRQRMEWEKFQGYKVSGSQYRAQPM